MIQEIELMIKLEGLKAYAYYCTAGYRTVGLGYNMDAPGAKMVWEELNIDEDFTKVYNREQELSQWSAVKLFDKIWTKCERQAKDRCAKLKVDWFMLPDWHQFILKDIAYNVGSLRGWTKVVKETDPFRVLIEARRKPHDIMDSRVAKIAKNYGFIETVEDAKEMGLEYTKYVD